MLKVWLHPRERKLLKLKSDGFSNEQMSEMLKSSTSAIRRSFNLIKIVSIAYQWHYQNRRKIQWVRQKIMERFTRSNKKRALKALIMSERRLSSRPIAKKLKCGRRTVNYDLRDCFDILHGLMVEYNDPIFAQYHTFLSVMTSGRYGTRPSGYILRKVRRVYHE